MKLILQKDVKNLGKTGDEVNVKKGYARNHLLPNKLALILNESRLKDWNHKKKIIENKKKQALSERQDLLKKISGIELCFERESRTEGKIFGSITVAEISKVLERDHALSVDKKDIKTEALKEIGEYNITVALDSENKTELKVKIKQKFSKKEEENSKKSKKGFFAKKFFSRDSSEKKEEEETEEQVRLENSEKKEESPSEENSEEKKE